jgi:hypothetical protein
MLCLTFFIWFKLLYFRKKFNFNVFNSNKVLDKQSIRSIPVLNEFNENSFMKDMQSQINQETTKQCC